MIGLTRFHRVHGLLLSKRRQGRIGGQSLLDPRKARLGRVQQSRYAGNGKQAKQEHSPGTGIQAPTGNRGNPRIGVSNLPAGLHRKVTDAHPEWSSTRARSSALVGSKVFVTAGSASELDNQTLAHEVGTILI